MIPYGTRVPVVVWQLCEVLYTCYLLTYTHSLFRYSCIPFALVGTRLSCKPAQLASYDYVQLGRLVALTLLQGGSGLPVFSPPVAQYLLTGQVTTVTPAEFPNNMQQCIAQVYLISYYLAPTSISHKQYQFTLSWSVRLQSTNKCP